MKIDWFTLVAQIVNFLVLVWLLKRYLYVPVISAMNQREAKIAERLMEAMSAKQAAEESDRQFREKLEELASTRESLQAAAGYEVELWLDEHLSKAKSEIQDARKEWHRGLAREKKALLQQLQLEGTQHAIDISRHLLKQLADERLQSQIIGRFLNLLVDADAETKLTLRSTQHSAAILVETSLELNAADRERISAGIRDIAGTDTLLDFRVNPKLVCGIELRAAGNKMAWSVRESLAELESDLIDAIDQAIPSTLKDSSAEGKPESRTSVMTSGLTEPEL